MNLKSNLSGAAILLCASLMCAAQAPDWASLSKKIVNETVGIKAGDVVLIRGGKHTLPLMEQIAAEVHRKGAAPHMLVESDVALNALYREKPEANLADYPKHMVEWMKEIDYEIILPTSENFTALFKDIDNKRTSLMQSTRDRFLKEMAAVSHSSEIIVGYPTKQEADFVNIDFPTYEKMHWASVNTDSKAITDAGNKIMGMLKGAKQVRITTKEGTDVSFSMGDRYVFADDGVLSDKERTSRIMFERFANLPGGFMDFAPNESSVNGKLIVPRSNCNFESARDITVTIKNGTVEKLEGSKGAPCYEKIMGAGSGKKMTVSVFTIGLNPEQKVIQTDNTDHRPRLAAGYMTIGIGGNNSQYNGMVSDTRSFSLPIVNATLEIDGKVAIKDGKIVVGQPGQAQ